MLTPKRFIFLTFLASALLGGARPGAAEVLILSSTVDGLKAGAELADSERLVVPKDHSVRLLLPSGMTALVKGPEDKTVSEFSKGQSRVEALWKRVRAFFDGADSSLNAGERGAKELLSWGAIPIPAPEKEKSTICIANGAAPVFVREDKTIKEADTIGENSMKFAPGDTMPDFPRIIRWGKGAAQAAWPEGVLALDRGRYFIVPDFAEASVIELRLIEKESVEGDEVLNVLWRNNCREQVTAWLQRTAPTQQK